MTRAHRDAVIASLQTDLPGSVFKSYSAADKSRYAVVFIARSSKRRTRFTGPQSQDVFTVTVHSVGTDEDSALWVQERVDKLTDRRLSVSGRSLFPVEFITGQPADLDDDGPAPLWFAVSQFDITSDLA
jgi:hypothetical protein